LESFVYRFSTNPSITILGGDDFTFPSGNVPATPTGIILPNATETVLTEGGFYEVSFVAYVIGALTSVSINLNGAPVPGGTAGGLAATNIVQIEAIIEADPGDVLTISNNSFTTIGFPCLAPGCVIASLTVLRLS
jgi:hypothetical protein